MTPKVTAFVDTSFDDLVLTPEELRGLAEGMLDEEGIFTQSDENLLADIGVSASPAPGNAP